MSISTSSAGDINRETVEARRGNNLVALCRGSVNMKLVTLSALIVVLLSGVVSS